MISPCIPPQRTKATQKRIKYGSLVILSLLSLPADAASFNISFASLASSAQDSTFSTLKSTSSLSGSGINTITDPELSITAANFTHATTPVDALFASPNASLNVAWDYNLALDKLNGTGSGACGNGPNCGSLGVVGGASPNSDALNGSDSTHGDEALIINFGNGVVAANSISFDLRGYNTSAGSSRDTLWLYVEFRPTNGSPSDVSLQLPATTNDGTQTIAFSSLAGLNVTTSVVKFAILSNAGDAGFGRIAYSQSSVVSAPEPQTFAIAGAAVAFLLFARASGWTKKG